jgi:transcriptional regulator with XRE-family HTH domain
MGEGSLGTRIRMLREERGLSLDDLAYAARRWAPKMTGGYIGRLERDEKYPSVATIEALARGLEIDPTAIPEYRLGVARRALDERAVGLGPAIATLEELSKAVARKSPPPALEDFAQALEALSPGTAATRRGRASKRPDQGTR